MIWAMVEAFILHDDYKWFQLLHYPDKLSQGIFFCIFSECVSGWISDSFTVSEPDDGLWGKLFFCQTCEMIVSRRSASWPLIFYAVFDSLPISTHVSSPVGSLSYSSGLEAPPILPLWSVQSPTGGYIGKFHSHNKSSVRTQVWMDWRHRKSCESSCSLVQSKMSNMCSMQGCKKNSWNEWNTVVVHSERN